MQWTSARVSVTESAPQLQADAHGGLSKFVVPEVEDYLDCAILQRGCEVLSCAACGLSRVVALSCKRRGFRPSCCGGA